MSQIVFKREPQAVIKYAAPMGFIKEQAELECSLKFNRNDALREARKFKTSFNPHLNMSRVP